MASDAAVRLLQASKTYLALMRDTEMADRDLHAAREFRFACVHALERAETELEAAADAWVDERRMEKAS